MKHSAMEIRRDAFLDDLSSQVAIVLRELNIADAKAEIAAAEVTAKIVANFGGQQLYIPKDYTHKHRSAPWQSMRRAMAGTTRKSPGSLISPSAPCTAYSNASMPK